MSPLLAVWRRSTQRLGAACRRAAVVFVAGLAWQVVWKRRVWYWDEQLWSQTTFFFFFLICNLYSLQNTAWNLFVLWNTVILWLWQRAAECFLMSQWQLFLSFDLFGKHQANVDLSLTTRKLAVAFCTLRHYHFCFRGFKRLKMILSVEVFEERNRCLTVYTERPWQGVSSRFVLLSRVRLIPKYVILTPLLSWYKKA